MKLKKLSVAVLAMTGFVIPAFSQGSASFTYCDPAATLVGWGTSKNEVYHIAIHVDDPTMVGKKIVGMEVNAPYSENISDIKAFITTKLDYAKPEGATAKQNIADVETVNAIDNHGTYSAQFTPYVLPEGGVYVGYQFTVNNLDAVTRTPVACNAGTNDNAFWVCTSRTYMQWKARSTQYNYISTIKVHFEGDFESNSLSLEGDDSVVIMAGNSFKLPITLINYGTEPIKNLDYTIEVDGEAYSSSLSFNPALTLSYGGREEVTFEYNKPTTPGQKTVKVSIDKINGQENNNDYKQIIMSLGMLSFVPVKRPVMEEYTGLGCGYCPRGFAAMEYMNKKYGMHSNDGRFIALAFHNYSGDPMCTISITPNSPSGYPACYMDRRENLDPYYGTGKAGFGIEEYWKNLAKEFTPVDITEIKANYIEGTIGDIQIDATVKFAREAGGRPRLVYFLVGDEMQDDSYIQSNYFSGNNPASWDLTEMEKFCKGSKYVSGLTFDDVVLMAGNVRGETYSLNGSLPLNTDIHERYTFNLQNCNSLNIGINLGMPYLKNGKQMRAVVMCVDTNTGRILNANWAKVNMDPAGVEVSVESEEVSTEYYDLSGNKVVNPSNGLYIRVTTYSDGKRSSEKVAIK